MLVGLVVAGCLGAQTVDVRPGIDVLLADSVHLVRGRRIGLLTNQTGVDAHGVDDLTRMRQAGVAVTAIFSPEHGFRGQLDSENIGQGVDSATGIPIYSLYGDHRAPTSDMLKDVDVLVIDLQDIGARTYTYVSTALLAIRAATTRNVPVIVVDRPDPIGGTLVQGPVLDTAWRSFVGMLPVPLRHGMTIGELLRMATASGEAAVPTVVPVAGWRRSLWFDATGLPWVRPSPNMPDLESATHYPGTVLFEGTSLSVGRGTPVAFQVIGAPWLDPARVIARVRAVAGVSLGDTVLVPRAPSDGKFPDQAIRAIRLRVTDRSRYDPVILAARLLVAVRAVHGSQLTFDPQRFDGLAGSSRLRDVVEAGQDLAPLLADWARADAAFERARRPFLLYPDELP